MHNNVHEYIRQGSSDTSCHKPHISEFGQVMYDTRGLGDGFRQNSVAIFGTWHVMKMLSTVVWRAFQDDFIGPLFHTMFPNNPFPTTPRLIVCHRFFTLLRLAYPSFSNTVKLLLTKEGLAVKERNHLLNLQDMCEFFIPTVRKFLTEVSTHYFCLPRTLSAVRICILSLIRS
jgi:hypothetical protein